MRSQDLEAMAAKDVALEAHAKRFSSSNHN